MPDASTAKDLHPPSTKPMYSARVEAKVTPFPKLLERITRQRWNFPVSSVSRPPRAAVGRKTNAGSRRSRWPWRRPGRRAIQWVAQYTLKAAEHQAHYRDFQPRAEEIWRLSRKLSLDLVEDAQEDEKAYSTYRELAHAVRTTVRAADRDQLMAAKDEALKWSTVVPLRISTTCRELAEMGVELLDHGYKGARSECLSAVTIALGSSEGATHTVSGNLEYIEDAAWANEQRQTLQLRESELLELRLKLLKRLYPRELLRSAVEDCLEDLCREPSAGQAVGSGVGAGG